MAVNTSDKTVSRFSLDGAGILSTIADAEKRADVVQFLVRNRFEVPSMRISESIAYLDEKGKSAEAGMLAEDSGRLQIAIMLYKKADQSLLARAVMEEVKQAKGAIKSDKRSAPVLTAKELDVLSVLLREGDTTTAELWIRC